MLLTDTARLLLFPAMMAFAASSDLFTMTISNRVSLILVGGFFALAFWSGMSPNDVLSHVGAAFAVLAVTFVFFARGWIGGGDAKLAAATALWLGFDHLMEISALRLHLRRHSDDRDDPLPADAVAGCDRAARMGQAPAQARWRRALRHRARRGRAPDLPRNDLDEVRPVISERFRSLRRRPLRRLFLRKTFLTAFGYAPLTTN